MVIEAPENTREAWSARAAEHPEPWTAAGWSRSGQRLRHSAVVEALAPQPGDKLLDFGCGTGELARLIPDEVGYVGYDWASGMVERGRRDHPGRSFVDWLPTGHFDLVAAIGCFNLPTGWSKQHTWWMLRHLWETARPRTMAVSLYAGDDPNCLRYTAEECWQQAWNHQEAPASAKVLPHLSNDLLLVVTR